MLALALETSGRTGSVALHRDGVLIAERSYPHGLQHAAAVVPMVDELCRSHGLAPSSIEAVYVSAGPGSFTGLRVGVTMAKTLAFATGAKLVAVPTVDVLAANAPPEATNVIVILDAKRGQIFTARFARSSEGALTAIEPAHLDTLKAMLDRTPRPVWLIGEGIDYHREAIPIDPATIVGEKSAWTPRAAVVAELGSALAAAGQFVDPYKLTPIYIRLAEAEEKRLANLQAR
ncbi:MAG: tRNA (adenosine(37)-N6)-threonylcarbamoyltransferase complex dimerization subunit type 1 TsaB [Tepidisphaeraceae bacterium]